MVKHKQKITWLLSVTLVAALMNSLLSPALALFTKTIQVQTGVNFYVDDKKLTPKDSNGNPIEAFLYNGTTYLPVRVVSEALDIPIQWENDTKSVYIGKHTGDKPAMWISEINHFDIDGHWDINKTIKDNLGNEHPHSLAVWSVPALGGHPAKIAYYLNRNYTQLTGLYYQKFENRSSSSDKTTLEIYADNEKVWEATVGPGIMPVEINLNVKNVSVIEFRYKAFSGTSTAIGELGLWT